MSIVGVVRLPPAHTGNSLWCVSDSSRICILKRAEFLSHSMGMTIRYAAPPVMPVVTTCPWHSIWISRRIIGNFRISWVCIAGVKWLNDASGTHVRAMSNPKFPLPGPKNAAPYDSRVGQSITSFHCVADAGSDIGIRALACASVLTGCILASAQLSPRPPTVPFDMTLPPPREPREDQEEDDAEEEEEEDEEDAAASRSVASELRSDEDAALSLGTRPRDFELDIFLTRWNTEACAGWGGGVERSLWRGVGGTRKTRNRVQPSKCIFVTGKGFIAVKLDTLI